jgi:NADH-quinone oxidoreductase subunit J
VPLWANSWNWIGTHGTLLVPLILGAVAVWALLPKHKHRQLLLGCVTGLGALVIGGIVLPQSFGPNVPLAYELLFFPFAGMAVVAGLLMIVQRNPVYSALWFAVVILNTCGLFLLQGGTFLAAATIIIYTGAIIVTFLFVMMLAQQTGTADYDRRAREPFLATLAGFVLLGGLLYALEITYKKPTQLPSIQDRLETARHRLRDPQVKVKDVADELSVDPTDGKRRSLREMLEAEADRYPGWPGREQAKQQIAEAVRQLGRATANDDREKMKEVVEQVAKWTEAIRVAGERHIAKLAALPREKTSPLSRMELPQVKVPAGPPPDPKKPPPFQPKPGHVTGLGRSLFGDYLYAVALSAELLLVVTIGAIVITHRRKEAAA